MLIKKILLGDSADFSDDIEDKCLDNIKSRLFCLHFCDWIVVEIWFVCWGQRGAGARL